MKRIIAGLVLISLVTGCGNKETKNNVLDYATLDSLSTELVVEIGSGEQFLPGRLNQLVVAPNGDILVSDMANFTITQFDSAGKYVATIATKGRGPGEMPGRFRMWFINDGILMTRYQLTQKSYFKQNNKGIYEFIRSKVAEQIPKRPVHIIGQRTDSTYYATTNDVLRGIQEIIEKSGKYFMQPVVVVNAEMEIKTDSLYLLKDPRGYIGKIDGGIRFSSIPYRSGDQFLLMDNGKYMIARIDSSAFYIYNRNHERIKTIKLHVKPRPIAEEDLNYLLKEKEDPFRSEIAALVSDMKPPWLNVWVTNNYIWLHTDTSEEGKQIVVLDFEGNPVGKFNLSPYDDIKQIKGQKIYTIYAKPGFENKIRVYKINI